MSEQGELTKGATSKQSSNEKVTSVEKSVKPESLKDPRKVELGKKEAKERKAKMRKQLEWSEENSKKQSEENEEINRIADLSGILLVV